MKSISICDATDKLILIDASEVISTWHTVLKVGSEYTLNLDIASVIEPCLLLFGFGLVDDSARDWAGWFNSKSVFYDTQSIQRS
jgi:hypothetical protein